MRQASEYTVLVGGRHPRIYAAAAAAALVNGASKVVLKARGRAISRAVDASQIVARASGLVISSVSIGSERLEREGRSPVDVSTIEITIEPPAEIVPEPPAGEARKAKNKK